MLFRNKVAIRKLSNINLRRLYLKKPNFIKFSKDESSGNSKNSNLLINFFRTAGILTGGITLVGVIYFGINNDYYC